MPSAEVVALITSRRTTTTSMAQRAIELGRMQVRHLLNYDGGRVADVEDAAGTARRPFSELRGC